MTSSSAFFQLSPTIQRWIWKQGWEELRDIQEEAVAPVLEGRDVLISAATASGKTEAAFLPILSAVGEAAGSQLKVIYVSPLKALINDQEQRLSGMCKSIDVKVTPWHGDISSSRKRSLFQRPSGILLITPESLEAMFVLRGSSMPSLLADVSYFVVDELHAFIGSERGRQLQSLLHRADVAAATQIPRIGLSATLGDLDMASDFLRPFGGAGVVRITSASLNREVKLQVRGYQSALKLGTQADGVCEMEGDTRDDVSQDISSHIYKVHRGSTNLVFANARARVEIYSDLLRRYCERDKLPNEFLPHHGNLSKDLREDAEIALKSAKPTTVVATSTLELGIDIGSVDAVAQIGVPPSVASLKQRLGRSGRRTDQASIVRIYVEEEELHSSSEFREILRVNIVQSVAMVNLLIAKWVEPPDPASLHLSTLVQQVLSLIAQHGGISAVKAFEILCRTGPFGPVAQNLFANVLRDLRTQDLISQMHDGTLVLGLRGERLVNRFDFYSAFLTPDEWRLLANERLLGTLPIDFPLLVGDYLIFAGRRWEILGVNEPGREVALRAAGGGRPPRFGGGRSSVHNRIREEMLQIYSNISKPAFLDTTGQNLLEEGRKDFHRYGLRDMRIIEFRRNTCVFPWKGDRVLNTLQLQLRSHGLNVSNEGLYLEAHAVGVERLRAAVAELSQNGLADPNALAMSVENLITEKHHPSLSRPQLIADYAASRLDPHGALESARELSISPLLA